MKNVLLINTSINHDAGNSYILSNEFVDRLSKKFELTVSHRDLVKEPMEHLKQTEMLAWMTPEAQRNDEQKSLADLSDNLIKEVQQSDLLVIGLPMYNFGVPSQFKVWMDRIARAGVTFKYTEQGPVGLLANKRVIVLAARGGIYAGTDNDSQTTHVKSFFALLGITDVEFIYAEGLNMPSKELSIANAKEKMEAVFSSMG
ncbi:NAD(P)H-dependent oxidoreductase [Pseudoalteromonas sp. BZB3]|uniref:FMN-dependent NADH-azoreductase n=1 Tax=Pseudoalteromonas sp. BZB3 TaxID=3136670 RepID=UPI0032C3DA82